MTATMVLTEDEALEVLAFLITAARTQLNEAAEYGPLRLLTAAGRLAGFMDQRASPGTRALLAGPLKELYRELARSEVRHQEMYIDLACLYFEPGAVAERLEELLAVEALVMASLPLRASLY